MMDHNATMPLVQRLRGLPFFSQLGAEGMLELAKALAAAADIDQANAAVDWLLENSSELPTPADIRLAVSNSPRRSMPDRDQSCPHCAGTGLRSVYLVEVDAGRRGTQLRRAMCHSCAKVGTECKALVVPLDIGDTSIGGMLYCEARAKQVADQGMRVVRTAEACPACAYGRARGMAYAEREAERAEKLEKRRNGE